MEFTVGATVYWSYKANLRVCDHKMLKPVLSTLKDGVPLN